MAENDGVQQAVNRVPSHSGAFPSSGTFRKLPPRSQPESCPKHYWPYVHSYDGPWCNMPPHDLEFLARINYSSARPHLIEPRVFFDVARIRVLSREAFDNIMVAGGGSTYKDLHSKTNSSNRPAKVPAMRASKPCRQTASGMEQLAMEKLYKAWILDDTAACVANTQMIEFLRAAVRLYVYEYPDDDRAGYIDFFYDRISMKKILKKGGTKRLDCLLGTDFDNPSILRTRASTEAVKSLWDDAIHDFDSALHIIEEGAKHQDKTTNRRAEHDHTSVMKPKPREAVLRMTHCSKPTGLEMQVRIQRGIVLLEWACEFAALVVDPDEFRAYSNGEENEQDEEAEKQIVEESYDAVQLNAEAALRDILFFLSKLDYSPGAVDRGDQASVNTQPSGSNPPSNDAGSPGPLPRAMTRWRPRQRLAQSNVAGQVVSDSCTHLSCKVSLLFGTAFPLLPRFPPEQPHFTGSKPSAKRFKEPELKERVTYHPQLHEALHALLLCHVLLGTDRALLRKHALMVARLVSLSDRAGIFSTSFYTKSELDWLHVLEASNDWLDLRFEWAFLCQRKSRPCRRDREWDKGRGEIIAKWLLADSPVDNASEHEQATDSDSEFGHELQRSPERGSRRGRRRATRRSSSLRNVSMSEDESGSESVDLDGMTFESDPEPKDESMLEEQDDSTSKCESDSVYEPALKTQDEGKSGSESDCGYEPPLGDQEEMESGKGSGSVYEPALETQEEPNTTSEDEEEIS